MPTRPGSLICIKLVRRARRSEHGTVARLFPGEGYGFILSAGGEEIYMHRNSVVDGAFDRLRVGDEVRFFAHFGEGEKGLQASTVVPVAKHHPSPSPP